MKQTIYNMVVKHFFTQVEPAGYRDDDGVILCYYRTDGNMCAVGCLIEDEEYDPKMEQKSVYALGEAGLLPRRLLPHRILLKDLQTLHDNCVLHDRLLTDPETLKDLRRLGKQHNLDTKLLEDYERTTSIQ